MVFNPDNLNEQEHDPYGDAMTDEPSRFFGQVTIEAYTACFYQDAGGKWKQEPYNPELHGSEEELAKAEGRFLTTQVDITIAPISPTHKLISRSMGAKNRKRPEFQRIVRPSIEALAERIAEVKVAAEMATQTGVVRPDLIRAAAQARIGQFNPLREISGMWVGGEFVPRPDDEKWTTLKFTDVYANQPECAQAAATYYNREVEETSAEAEDNGRDAEKAALLPFIPPLWEQSQHEPGKMAEALAKNPLLSMHFTMDSPEVKEIVEAEIPY